MSATVTCPTLSLGIVHMLRELHAYHVRMAHLCLNPLRQVPSPSYDRHAALRHSHKATSILHELRDAGHDAEADALRAEAEGLERVLLEGSQS